MPVHVDRTPERGYGTVRIDRPTENNALGMEELTGIIDAFELLDSRGVDVVVLAGHPEVFSTGLDVQAVLDREGDVRALRELIDRVHQCYRAVETCSVPTVARLEGPAVSVGCELAFAADLRIATEDAELGLDGLDFGMVPPFERLRRLAGESLTNDLCLTDRRLSAAEAADHGLFNRVVPGDEITDAVEAVVDEIADKQPRAVEQFKQALRYADGRSVADTTEFRSQLEYVCFTESDFAERARRHVEEERSRHA